MNLESTGEGRPLWQTGFILPDDPDPDCSELGKTKQCDISTLMTWMFVNKWLLTGAIAFFIWIDNE